jgi:hypothetical protein
MQQAMEFHSLLGRGIPVRIPSQQRRATRVGEKGKKDRKEEQNSVPDLIDWLLAIDLTST